MHICLRDCHISHMPGAMISFANTRHREQVLQSRPVPQETMIHHWDQQLHWWDRQEILATGTSSSWWDLQENLSHGVSDCCFIASGESHSLWSQSIRRIIFAFSVRCVCRSSYFYCNKIASVTRMCHCKPSCIVYHCILGHNTSCGQLDLFLMVRACAVIILCSSYFPWFFWL